jgi:predicted nucleic acid-binding protein
VLSVGLVDVESARSLHRIHRDFEDDLLLATAQRAEVSYLVTSDVKLAAKSPVPTMNAADLLTLLSGS